MRPNDFCYLGSNLFTDLALESELRSRAAKTSAAFRRFENHEWKTLSPKMETESIVLKRLCFPLFLWQWYIGCLSKKFSAPQPIYIRRILSIQLSVMILSSRYLFNWCHVYDRFCLMVGTCTRKEWQQHFETAVVWSMETRNTKAQSS